MKIMNKFQKKLANRKKDNKGFSLVELIIVIAIMAILVGIVGTQVIPYISKSKVAKDQQVLNSISTAGVTAYSENGLTGNLIIDNVFDSTLTGDAKKVADDIIATSGFADLNAFKDALGADGKSDITAVSFTVTASSHKAVTAVSYSSTPKYPIKQVDATL